MKKFIVLVIFAIGLMFTLPAESSGSKAPPGQCSFVVSDLNYTTAVMLQVTANEVFVSKAFQLVPTIVIGCQEIGGVVLPVGVQRTYLIQAQYRVMASCGIEHPNNYRLNLLSIINSKARTQLPVLHLRTGSEIQKYNVAVCGELKIRADTEG